ncbi:uncharacterized protein LOC124450809 isoform X2 [Xenia sp. Carnegie-2017]|uniref:uncharacterized protein LOC124450809 isoform X2 n=1 Tax=Xenia sp. Carnegie-2017 TaxID=2897299 RepID=UPI001F034D86|nr:uncharacterized protein LOC124450809 isoform X2 [Xenia sp. Carnegie-2017]
MCFLKFLRHVFFLIGIIQFAEGKLLECGNKVKQQDECPKTCCFNHTVYPPCYFKERDNSPIQHGNGLCVNVKDASSLIWSRDCTSRNAFFLMSYDYPPHHLATGKCFLPFVTEDYKPGENVELILINSKYCGGIFGRYRQTTNGNLEFYNGNSPYKLCIGGSLVISNKWEPQVNEEVFINYDTCNVNNSCKFIYVYERKFQQGENLTIHCSESCSSSVIKVRSAEYGVLMDRKPYKISSRIKDCLSMSALSVLQKKCNGRSKCSFTVYKDEFLSKASKCNKNTTLLVYYTCKTPTLVSSTTPVTYIKTVETGYLTNGTSSMEIGKMKKKANPHCSINGISFLSKNWYFILVAMILWIIFGIFLSFLIFVRYRRRWLHKHLQSASKKKKSQTTDALYEEVDLSKMKKEERYKSSTAKGDMFDTTYQSLDDAKVDTQNNYQSLVVNIKNKVKNDKESAYEEVH